jgi:hypothetical protein
VEAVSAEAGAWPNAPANSNGVTWVYGTVVNYILGLAPTPENNDLLVTLQEGDALSLYMSTGLFLNFNVTQVSVGAAEEGAFFEQISPRLTLALLTEEPAQRTVVTAVFVDDETAEEELLLGTVAGVIGIPVDLGPVRVTVIEAYRVTASEAELPSGTDYLLIDFQTFVRDLTGGRYPLSMPAGQFANYGLPAEQIAPGETVIGSAGYLVPSFAGGAGGEVRWAFNPQPGSGNWVMVPVPYDVPAATATPVPPPPVGFARVSVDSNDVFIDGTDNLLIVGLQIENTSAGVVQVTEDDISLNSSGGELLLENTAPLLPWRIEPGEFRRFELQFELPFTNDALLNVLGYTFSIDNIGGG